jgi:hypothetical protein
VPFIAVTSPNGGEVWVRGETREIAWQATGFTGPVDIAYSTDGGESWAFIDVGYANTHRYSWTVPAAAYSAECLVWVQSSDGRVSDASDGAFEIWPSSIVVGWSTESQTVAEGAGVVTVTATLAAAGDGVVVPFTVSGTASSPSDHDLLSGSIVIPAPQLSGSTTFTVVDDSTHEGDETIIVTMSAPTGADLGAVTVHTVTISDNDPEPAVEWAIDSQAVAESAGMVTVTAMLSCESAFDVFVPFAVGGSAIAPDDHDLTDATLIIAAGTTVESAVFTVVDDFEIETNETVVLTMGLPTNATLGANSVHTVTVSDNDGVATVDWSGATQTVLEDVASVTVTATLSETEGLDVTVPFTVSGTAVNPDDHDLVDGSVVIPAGSIEATFTFGVIDDNLDEGDETVVLAMGVPTNAGLGGVVDHAVTITDNDAMPTVEWTSAGQPVGEEVGTVTVVAILSEESGRDVAVPFSVSGTAVNPDDHDLTNGSLVFPASRLSATVTVSVTDDDDAEMDETLVVTMGAPTNATAVAPTVHTVTIADNDLPWVEWEVDTQTVGEDMGTVTVIAALVGLSEAEVTVPFTVSGTAVNPGDHDLSDGSVVIAGGSASDSVTFAVADDALDEDDETVIVTMGTPTNALPAAMTAQSIIITDNDPSPTVEWTSASQATSESPVTVLVTAALSEASGRDVTVPFIVGGTATAPDDHDLADGSVVIPAGAGSASVGCGIAEDALDEDSETVVLTMGVPTNADPGPTGVHTITIVDDDPMPRVEWVVTSQAVGEGAGTVTVTATLSAPSARDVTAPYSVGGSAVNPDDHDLADGTLTIAAGSTSDTVTFDVVGDSDAEPNETVTLTIGAPTNANLGAVPVHTVTIADDDSDWDVTVTAVTAPPSANLGQAVPVDTTVENLGANDAGSFRVGVYLSVDNIITTSDMPMGARVVAGLVAGGTDAGATPATMPAGISLGTYYVGAIADDLDELPEVDEDNNAMASGIAIDVTGPDLIMTALAGPASADPGNPIDLVNTVGDIGTGDAGPFEVRFYLSVNDSISPEFDTQMGGRPVAVLIPTGTDAATTTVTVPFVSDGTYFIGGIVDAGRQIAESDETNNTFVSPTTIDIGAAPGWDPYEPDNTYGEATAIDIDGPPQAHNLHSSTDSDWLVVDVAAAMAIAVETSGLTGGVDTYLTLYDGDGTTVLAEDDNGGAAPASRIVWTFAGPATSYMEVTHAWPAFGSPGDYVIAVTTFDPGIGDVDLVAQGAGTWPEYVLAGESVMSNYQLQNAAADDSPAFRVGFYMSDDAIMDASDVLADTLTVAGLAAGGARADGRTVVVPAGTASGDYAFIMVVDDLDDVAETNELNNAVVGFSPVRVNPDVAVTAASAPEAANEGDTVDVANTIHNDGGCTLTNIQVEIYLSRDAEIDDTSDLLLAQRWIASPLAPGADDIAVTPVALPAPLDSGTWYIGIVAFLPGMMGPGWAPESDYSDNILADALVVTGTGAPDLVVTSLAATPLVLWPGDNLVIDDVTANAGSVGVEIDTVTRLVLSSDPAAAMWPTISVGFRTVSASAAFPLEGGAEDSGATAFVLPPVGFPGGTFYVVAQADDAGAVAEGLEQNNVLAAVERVSIMGPDFEEPANDTMSGAGFLDVWMEYPQPRTFHVAGDADWFRLNPMMPGTYTVETSHLLFGADTVIELFREGEETPIMVDDDGGSEPGATRLTFEFDFMGGYYVRVTHASGGTGHYMIELREGL